MENQLLLKGENMKLVDDEIKNQLSLKSENVKLGYYEMENLSVCGEHVKVGRVGHGEVVVVVLGLSTRCKNTHHLLRVKVKEFDQ